MKALGLSLLLCLLTAAQASLPQPASPVSWVDMQMGCKGAGGGVVGPQLPHGSVNPSPETPKGGMGAYKQGEPVRGFAPLHVTGTGWSKYGQVLLSPQIGLKVGEIEHDSPISSETATPAYYAAVLDRYGIAVAMAPTHNAVLYRFTYPKSSEAHLVFDLSHSVMENIVPEGKGCFLGGVTTLDPSSGAIEGHAEFKGGFGGSENPYSVYFYAIPDRAPAACGTFQDGVINQGSLHVEGGGRLGAFLRYETREGEAISLRIGLSLRSVANARRFLETEIPDFDLAKVRKAGETA